MPTIGLIAGEPSGDIHAANLVEELGRKVDDLRVWAVGGDRLRSAGAEIIFHYEEIAAMGLLEIVRHLPAIRRGANRVKAKLAADPPDLFIPVDFGGFNLRVARVAKRTGVPVCYFIPPKAWAWGGWRVKKVREIVDKALVILPFEETFWRSNGVDAEYVGSPVLDHLGARSFEPEPDIVGLLPGSRRSEINHIWPVMAAAAKKLSEEQPLRFLVPRADSIGEELLKPELDRVGLEADIIEGGAQQVMERARLCLMTSGTATLECALVGTPMVAMYRASDLSYAVARRVIRSPYVTLPNLIAEREVIPELLQTGVEEVEAVARPLLEDTPQRREMLEGLKVVKERMGAPGASARAAGKVAKMLEGIS